MKTGDHVTIEKFINHHSFKDQIFDLSGEYFTLHQYDLDSYDRRFAILDTRLQNQRFSENNEFQIELQRRLKILQSQGFIFISATPWESLHNIKIQPVFPKLDIEHIKWSGGVSWFWFYMYEKHKDKKYVFDHGQKSFDFLYLNKMDRSHRKRLFYKMEPLLANSLYSFWPDKIKLPKQFELPWVEDYPFRGLDQDIHELPYNQTKFSLISESNDTNDEIFFTEKIWKSIIAKHAFVVHGNHLYLQALRELGFKTFGAYFDESYDLDIDKNRRIEKIVETCKSLLQKNWEDIYMQTKALRQHNHDLFFDTSALSKAVNRTLELFLEFADSRQIPS